MKISGSFLSKFVPEHRFSCAASPEARANPTPSRHPLRSVEYLATKGSFFTGGRYFYEVGVNRGRPVWVTYQNSPVRFRAVQFDQGKSGG